MSGGVSILGPLLRAIREEAYNVQKECVEMRVIDLIPGIGTRAIGFQKVGFKVVCAVGEDEEDARIYKTLVQPRQFIHKSIQMINPEELPEADVIMAQLMTVPQMKTNDKVEVLVPEENLIIHDIISDKRPKFFVLEAPVSYLTRNNRLAAERLLSDYVLMDYNIIYSVLGQEEYSGYPVKGKQLFFVGIRNDITKREYYITEPPMRGIKRELKLEEAGSVDIWYRKVQPIGGTKYVPGKFYVRSGKEEKETDLMEEGFMREMYLTDSLGLRRITHNEIAWSKGIEGYDFNTCRNKQSMYRKLVRAGSVFVAGAVAESIQICAGYDIRKEGDIEEYKDQTSFKQSAIKNKKDNKQEPKKIIFPKQRLTNIHVNKLKGLKN